MEFKLIIPTISDDNYYLNLIDTQSKNIIGSLSFRPILDDYEHIMSDILSFTEEFYEIFENGNYFYIEQLTVTKEFRQKGFAYIIMKKFLELYNEKFKSKYPQIILNASPMYLTMSLEKLIMFYQKHGFRVMYDKFPNNALMIRDSK